MFVAWGISPTTRIMVDFYKLNIYVMNNVISDQMHALIIHNMHFASVLVVYLHF